MLASRLSVECLVACIFFACYLFPCKGGPTPSSVYSVKRPSVIVSCTLHLLWSRCSQTCMPVRIRRLFEVAFPRLRAFTLNEALTLLGPIPLHTRLFLTWALWVWTSLSLSVNEKLVLEKSSMQCWSCDFVRRSFFAASRTSIRRNNAGQGKKKHSCVVSGRNGLLT